MAAFVLKRVLWAFTLAFLISFITFVLFFIVPDETRVARSGSADQLVSLARQYDIQGQSIFEQYGRFVWRFLRHGDLGQSFVSRQPVMEKLASALPVTIGLVAGGAVLWLLLAFPIGIISALRPRSLLDRVGMVFVLIGISAHPVWIGLILSYVFGYKLHLTPIAGYCDFFNPAIKCGGALDWASHMLLPWLTFALLFAALYTRMIRAMVLETLQEEYVRTAQAKGAGPFRVLRVHVLRNAMLPLVTMVGMDVGLAFAGALFIETVFDLPGVGGMLYDATTRLDLPVIMGVFLVISLAVVVANLIADVACMVLDPRMHVSRVASYGKHQRPRLSSTGSGRASAPTPAQSASAASPR
ncbi:MAG: ABC transporter permease [Actinobacteria bacterium]|nr:ABC transporter permease [Actinomycetota bacterium]